ncbi:hypothetical protein BC833DRAFT_617561 [Globomyces pollinis-pini]|nr:hypothetical protein BC833DRAFT_617561 [Globomyces pollinis-pini]
MEQFKSAYFGKCKELSIEPLTALVNRIDTYNEEDPKGVTETLDLSGQSISIKSAAALSTAIAESPIFTSLILADCFLGDDGCVKIALALKLNTSITRLDLRGNSIRSDGAIAIAQMLKVNTKLETLLLEWNCVGIWDSGIQSIAESLSMNEYLQVLDLRNNKIGPQAAMTISTCLKHNTSLRKLDLRWNNIGLIGGRAFVDLLKWNKTLMDLELAGNEIPEDVLRAISTSTERNKERWQHEYHTKAHTQTLTTTIQTLTAEHRDVLLDMQNKLSKKSSHSLSLSEKLAQANTEIDKMQSAYRSLAAHAEKAENDRIGLEEQLVKERFEFQSKISEIQKEIMFERDRRQKYEEKHQKHINASNGQYFEIESKLKTAVLEAEMLLKDKSNLMDELSRLKEKERHLNELWEEKLERVNHSHHNKLMAFQEAKDKEAVEKLQRLEEKLKIAEMEITRTETAHDSTKAKFLAEKRHWSDQLLEVEQRVRKEDEIRRKEIEHQLKSLSAQRDTLQSNVETLTKTNQQLKKDYEQEFSKLQIEKRNLQQEIMDWNTKSNKHQIDLSHYKNKLDEARSLESDLLGKISELNQIHKDDVKLKKDLMEELEKFKKQLSSKTNQISKLKEELKIRDQELDEKEEENVIRMKELQMSITSLLQQRSKKSYRRYQDDDT